MISPQEVRDFAQLSARAAEIAQREHPSPPQNPLTCAIAGFGATFIVLEVFRAIADIDVDVLRISRAFIVTALFGGIIPAWWSWWRQRRHHAAYHRALDQLRDAGYAR